MLKAEYRVGLLVIAALLGIMACAKKMLPPSPDRFAPRLEEIVTRNRSQVELVFDEPIDGRRVFVDSFYISDASGLAVRLRGASLGRSSSSVMLWTPVQLVQLYRVRGVVWDMAGNAGRFQARFRGSDRQDTIRPGVSRISPAPAATGLRYGASVAVRFSEPVDTSVAPEWLFVPEEYDTLFRRTWEVDWQTVRLAFADTLRAGSIVYVQLLPGFRDLEANRSRTTAFTYFTPDSVFAAELVKGRVRFAVQPAAVSGTVFFFADTSTKATGLAALLPDGSYATRLRAGTWHAVAVCDTDFDNIVDLSATVRGFAPPQDSLDFQLAPETRPGPIRDFRRR
ncbi:MAG: Ig-like domain-containing protein [candidate division WOR-3 bacterium]